MAEEMNNMQRPPMPDMAGANMQRPQAQPPAQPQSGEMPQKAKENVMKASPQLAAVLITRLGAMTEAQLDQLDKAISPEAARALLILLPELAELMQAITSGGDAAPAPMAPEMGALGGVA
jgi:hypothetical protein|tara:strand:+ start:60 stop:419 length:360 start_codon:yes stop_codon:yes gene_type:complete